MLRISCPIDRRAGRAAAGTQQLTDFTEWCRDVTVPRDPDKKFPYWENLSWENADKYQPDLLLLDDHRIALTGQGR